MAGERILNKLILIHFHHQISMLRWTRNSYLSRKSTKHSMLQTRGDHEPSRSQKNLPIKRAGPGLNSGRFFVPKARYFGLKLAGFFDENRVGPKNRLKSRFWFAQSQNKSGRAEKICPKRVGLGQNDHLYSKQIFNLLVPPYMGTTIGQDRPLWYHDKYIAARPAHIRHTSEKSLTTHKPKWGSILTPFGNRRSLSSLRVSHSLLQCRTSSHAAINILADNTVNELHILLWKL